MEKIRIGTKVWLADDPEFSGDVVDYFPESRSFLVYLHSRFIADPHVFVGRKIEFKRESLLTKSELAAFRALEALAAH